MQPLVRSLVTACALLTVALSGLEAHATALLVPTDPNHPPLALKHHRVEIQVHDGTATTSVDQVFVNHTKRALEATLVFPLPKGAVITDVELSIGGKLVKGEVMDRDDAARIYSDIVRRMKDPALVEWMGCRLFRARVFPVPAQGEQRIRVTYTEALEFKGGNYVLTYPLRTPHAAATTLQDFTLTVRLNNEVPIGALYSPTHRIDVSRDGTQRAVVGFEGDRVTLDRDFTLFMGRAEGAVGLSLLTHRIPGEPGYFMLMASPREVADLEARSRKDVTFVLDTSGSMRGKRLAQARAALRWCLDALGPRDRFNVLRFASDVERFAPDPVPVTPARLREARDFVAGFRAAGGTAIGAAIEASLARRGTAEVPHLVLFITDGRPTVGETGTEQILALAQAGASPHSRLFTLGVGDGLDTVLLDRLAQQLRGSSAYVGTEDAIDTHISALYAQVAHPVFTDITMDIQGVRTFQALPSPIGDLFKGGQLMVLGRYRAHGEARIRLSGRLAGQARRFDFQTRFPREDTAHPFIAKLWAHRQVGQLLDQARLRGETPELKGEIVALATRFGIVTPYTSFLVVEPGAPPPVAAPVRPPPHHRATFSGRGAGGGGATPRAPGARSRAEKAATARARVSGDLGEAAEELMLESAAAGRGGTKTAEKRAVSRSKVARHLKNKRIDEAEVSTVRHVAGRVFIWRGGQWVDRAWREGMGEVHLAPYSPHWLRLADRDEGLREAFALGERLIVVLGDTALVIRPGAPKVLPRAKARALGL